MPRFLPTRVAPRACARTTSRHTRARRARWSSHPSSRPALTSRSAVMDTTRRAPGARPAARRGPGAAAPPPGGRRAHRAAAAAAPRGAAAGVPGQQRDAVPGGDQRLDHGEVVDPLHDPRRRARRPSATASSTAATGKPSRTAIQSSPTRSSGRTASRSASGWSGGDGDVQRLAQQRDDGQPGPRARPATARRRAGAPRRRPPGRSGAGNSSCATSSSEHSRSIPPRARTRVSSPGAAAGRRSGTPTTRTVPPAGRGTPRRPPAPARGRPRRRPRRRPAPRPPRSAAGRGRRARSAAPRRRGCSAASCCDTADGVRCSTAAAALTPPCVRTARSVSSARTSMQRRYNDMSDISLVLHGRRRAGSARAHP